MTQTERRVSHSRIADLPADCAACAARTQSRSFCGPCAAWRGLPDCWRCGDKGWAVLNGRWSRCACAGRTKEARNEE